MLEASRKVFHLALRTFHHDHASFRREKHGNGRVVVMVNCWDAEPTTQASRRGAPFSSSSKGQGRFGKKREREGEGGG